MIWPAAVALLAWLYLLAGHGGFWRTNRTLPPVSGDPAGWPSVVAVVPARDEATMLPRSLPTLLAQDYPGEFRIVVVDDASTDGTGAVAREVGGDRVQVVTGSGPPPGWAGKVAAMAAGTAAAGTPDYLLFTDADIAHPAGSVTALVRAAEGDRRDLVSLMARLGTETLWERVIVPAFVYFFAQLYPFRRVCDPRSRVAAAAGGCVLVRRSALAAAGGLEAIRGALIDDVALGRLVKSGGSGRIWLGLGGGVTSLRRYPRFADLWDMVARSAYTQLRHSPVLLLATVLGLAELYLVPPLATLVGVLAVDPLTTVAGALAWLVMAGTFVPMLRHYGLGPARALLLPFVALAYAGMTVDSAVRELRGHGGAWKGRTAPAR